MSFRPRQKRARPLDPKSTLPPPRGRTVRGTDRHAGPSPGRLGRASAGIPAAGADLSTSLGISDHARFKGLKKRKLLPEERPPKNWRDSVLEFARSCHQDEEHSRQVAKLALEIFDAVASSFRLDEKERQMLEAADEVIVVDNGSTDRTKEQVWEVAAAFPDKIRFLERPDLVDLWQNRQTAFEETRYRWIVRGDSDYICYTSGEWDAIHLRTWLLSLPVWPPKQIMVGQSTVTGDFRHKSCRFREFGSYMPRLYSWVPGMRFARLGRWEGVRYPPLVARLVDSAVRRRAYDPACGLREPNFRGRRRRRRRPPRRRRRARHAPAPRHTRRGRW